ncbi:MAG: hypothetical protein JKY32_01490 [Rhizobiales bacterium]|nr:hypothetical protein [Hyphomicrobiales bacterium]
MSNSIFIAKLMGPMMLVAGITYLMNIERLKAMGREIMESPGLLLVVGFLTLLLGLVLVNTHNVWVADWPVIITLFGWMALVSGTMRTMFPTQMVSIGTSMINNNLLLRSVSVLQIALGAYLCWEAYLV